MSPLLLFCFWLTISQLTCCSLCKAWKLPFLKAVCCKHNPEQQLRKKKHQDLEFRHTQKDIKRPSNPWRTLPPPPGGFSYSSWAPLLLSISTKGWTLLLIATWKSPELPWLDHIQINHWGQRTVLDLGLDFAPTPELISMLGGRLFLLLRSSMLAAVGGSILPNLIAINGEEAKCLGGSHYLFYGL